MCERQSDPLAPGDARDQLISGLARCSARPQQVLGDVVRAAEGSLAHVIDVLGSGPTFWGDRIEWHADMHSGDRWDPDAYYADIEPAAYPGGADVKVPWEVSRFQHGVWLGQAYVLTGEEEYATEVVRQICDWIERNPPLLGVNWTCTMDVAIRVVNWLWALGLIDGSKALADGAAESIYSSLRWHGRHIMLNLENRGRFSGNHYLSDLAGLLYLGCLLPSTRETEWWRRYALRHLEREIVNQVGPDGVDFEASTAYHRLVTEIFSSSAVLARTRGYRFSTEYMARLEKMVEFVMYLTKPDGTVPLIGDNDNGRLHRLKVWHEPSREWSDHRYLLAIGGVLFDRDDLATAAGDEWEEAYWLLGDEALRRRDATRALAHEPHRSRAYPDAGIYVLRHDDHYMVVDAGSNGQKGNGGHAHNDTLSFEVYAGSRSWIVDPGTYVYTADYDARNRYRSTAVHNTVMVEGEEQCAFARERLFAMDEDIDVEVERWIVSDDYDLIVASHGGYGRLWSGVRHRRTVLMAHTERVWIVRDEILGASGLQCQANLSLAPGLTTEPVSAPDSGIRVRDAGGGAFLILGLSAGASRMRVEPSAVAPTYGREVVTSAVRWNWTSGTRSDVALMLESMEAEVEHRIWASRLLLSRVVSGVGLGDSPAGPPDDPMQAADCTIFAHAGECR